MSDDTDRINALERLPRRRAPERDLWPGIESRLAPRRRSRWALVELAVAASLVAGLAGVFTLGLRDAGSPAGGLDVAAAPRELADDSRAIVQANLSMVEQAERELRKAIKQDPESTTLRSLLRSAEQRQHTLRAML